MKYIYSDFSPEKFFGAFLNTEKKEVNKEEKAIRQIRSLYTGFTTTPALLGADSFSCFGGGALVLLPCN